MRSALVLIVVLLLSGCATSPLPPPPVTGLEADYQNATVLVTEKKYPEAISAFRKISDENPHSPFASDSLFEAAYLQAFYDNPQKNYALALAWFEEFLKLYPKHDKSREAKNFRMMLKTIVDTKKENEQLLESIEQLNQLDIRHEERRRK